MASSSASGAKRVIDAIDLGSTDEDEPSPKKAAAGPKNNIALPAGSRALRSVDVPAGWSVHGGSLLVRGFGDLSASSKVAAFDFDGCLADTPLGGNDPKAWKMQFTHVPQVLQELHSEGYALVIVTNESMDRFKKPDAIRSAILKKTGRLTGFAEAAKVPILALCATAKDDYRKPAIGAWTFFEASCNGGMPVDLGQSFFVGDAAGRPGDHSDSDAVFARRARLAFHDEKTFFQKMHPPQ